MQALRPRRVRLWRVADPSVLGDHFTTTTTIKSSARYSLYLNGAISPIEARREAERGTPAKRLMYGGLAGIRHMSLPLGCDQVRQHIDVNDAIASATLRSVERFVSKTHHRWQVRLSLWRRDAYTHRHLS